MSGPGSSANEAARAWVFFVGEDLRMAELAFSEALYNQFCFHSHQATEKALKALLANRSEAPPRTHKLVDLVALVEQEEPNLGLTEFAEGFRKLEGYYVPARYPDALTGSLPEGLPGEQEAEYALGTARRVSQEVLAVIEHNGETEGSEQP